MAVNNPILLAQNAGATPQAPSVVWLGGAGMITVEATFGGGTVTFQVLSALNTWIAIGIDTTFTANGAAGFVLPEGAQVRVLVVTSTAVYAFLRPL